jgi:uncharacterized protein
MGTKTLASRTQMALFAVFLFASACFAAPAMAAESSTSLKIIVYGASGRVGSRVVDEALSRGHRVTAVSRDPTRITHEHDRLTPVEGDVLDRASVARLVKGQDIVVVSVRGGLDDSGDPLMTVHRQAVEVIVPVLRNLGDSAPRLIFVGGAGSLEVKPGVIYADNIGFFGRMFIADFILQEIQGHILVLEYLRQVDDVRWTYISPPKDFEPGERSGNYRIGGDTMLKDVRGNSEISMEDYAVALVDEAENADFIGKRFSVAY